MLEFFRRNVGGLLGVFIVGLLSIAFAFSFGAQSEGWGKGQKAQLVASVDGTEIPEATLQYAFRMMGGRSLTEDDPQAVSLRHLALEGVIERELLVSLAGELGITASSDEAEENIANNKFYLTRPVKDVIRRMEQSPFASPEMVAQMVVSDGHELRQSFENEKGEFDLDGFRKFIRNYIQITEENFVEQQRRELIALRVRQLLAGMANISPSEVKDAYQRANDTASIEFVRLAPAYFEKTLEVSPEKLEAWTNEHQDEIDKYYDTNKFKYTGLEKQVKARHILIKADKDADEDEKSAARAKADDLLRQVKDGADFAELAREHSDDPGSAEKGGDLGFNPKGRMVPTFDEAMFSLALGQVSDVVETDYGFHIIKVEAIREGDVPVEEAKNEIAEKLYREARGRKLAQNKADEYLAGLKGGSELSRLVGEPDAKDFLAPKVRTSRPFSSTTTNIPGLGKAPEIVEAAFALTEDAPTPSKVYEVGDDFVVFALAERQKPSDEDFEKKRDEISENLLALKRITWLSDEIFELENRAKKSGRLEIPGSKSADADETPQESSKQADAPDDHADAAGQSNDEDAE